MSKGMQYLTIKTAPPLKNGTPLAKAVFVTKTKKFGEVTKEEVLSVKRPILVTGANSSGKSRWIKRLREDAARIWAMKPAAPLYLSAARPLAAWTDTKELELWWAGRKNCDDQRHWTKLKAWERVDFLPLYLAETKAVLFVDDAHLITGRKLKVLEECISAAVVFVMGTAEENRLAPTVRHNVMYRQPQIFRLKTEVAYDATPLVMWCFIAAAALAQMWMLVMVLGGLKLLGSGRRATKQN
jgi:adenosyl cobinamide kinase/adenosyl cobinamide phosphate guanylyltransferase